MRSIQINTIIEQVKKLCIDANYNLPPPVVSSLEHALGQEDSPQGKRTLKHLIENAHIAEQGLYPLCQDTGFAVFFVEMGNNVKIQDGLLDEAINEGVRIAYMDEYLRSSIVKDPLHRVNTGDNTPAVIWTEIVKGDKLKISMAPKGGGSENMSEVAMLKPAQGVQGIKKFVIDKVSRSGGNPCPPIIVGVGIGGTFEKVAWLAKKSLLRHIGERNQDPFYANLEQELLTQINDLGIGPMGLGGRTTALDVFIETFPCHIASLPVAVNVQCHSARHKSVTI